MNTLTIATPNADRPVMIWAAAIEPFLNMLDSPQTRRAYRVALQRSAPGVVFLGQCILEASGSGLSQPLGVLHFTHQHRLARADR
jgi:hypothetical protein